MQVIEASQICDKCPFYLFNSKMCKIIKLCILNKWIYIIQIGVFFFAGSTEAMVVVTAQSWPDRRCAFHNSRLSVSQAQMMIHMKTT